MTSWNWFRPFREEHRGGAFAQYSGNTFLYDGDSLVLLDREGKETEVGSEEEIAERAARGKPTKIAISDTALYMACYFENDDEQRSVTVYNRRGKPVDNAPLSYNLESLFFETPEMLIGMVDEEQVRRMFAEPLYLVFSLGKGKALTPEIDPRSQDVLCRHKDHSVHNRGDGKYEIQRRNKTRATFDSERELRLVHFSPTGKSFSALEDANMIATYSLDGQHLGLIEGESEIDDFRYYEDGSILYTGNDRVVKIGPTGNLQWKKTHVPGVRGSGRVEAESGYFMVYFEADGGYHSWVYDVFGNELYKHETNYPHQSRLFVHGKSLWVRERGRVGLASLYGD